MANLIIFIDGFPFEKLSGTQFLNTLNKSRRVPGLGYSFTLFLEIFVGLLPDESGIFGEFEYNNRRLSRFQESFRFLLKFFDQFGILSAGLRRFATNYCGYPIHNIPFQYVCFFKNIGFLKKNNFNIETIFDKLEKFPNSKIYNHFQKCYSDQESYKLALENVDKENLFIHFAELDAVSHQHFDSKKYQDKIEWLDAKIKEIWDLFSKLHPEANLVVVSDHGFVPVKEYFNFRPEKISSFRPGKDYVFILDSTMCRLWFFRPKIESFFKDYLTKTGNGRVISEEERKILGVSNKKFGDIIFLLEPGIIFFPSFFGGLVKPKGMHGYSPDCREHHGIFLAKTSKPTELPVFVQNKETFFYLLNTLGI